MDAPKTMTLRSQRDEDLTKTAAPGSSHKKNRAANKVVPISMLLHDVARMRNTIIDQAVKEIGVTRAQCRVLANISRKRTQGMSQSYLARLLNVGKPTVGRLIDRLTEKGMVQCRAQSDDRRVKKIYITDYGYNLIHYMSPIVARLDAACLEGIDQEDIKVADAVLHQLKRNLAQIVELEPKLRLPKSICPNRQATRAS